MIPLVLALSLAADPTLALGDARVKLIAHGDGGVLMLNVHDDENTSVDAALSVIATRGGHVLELQHGGARLIDFTLGAEHFTIDPNRIFTEPGIAATLRKNGKRSPAAIAATRAFAEALLQKMDYADKPLIVALHNNTPALSFSILSYQHGADEKEARAVHVDAQADPNDFFLVLERPLFDALAARGFNVVLQKVPAETDDGSLSVRAARDGVRYVNVEAQHGHLEQQQAMLNALLDVLSAKKN